MSAMDRSPLPTPRTRVSHVMLAAMAIPLALARAAHAVAAAAVSSTAATAAGDADASSKSVFGWWEVMLHGSRAELFALASPRWWLAYIAAEFEAEPAHVIVEVACILTIIYLMLLRKPAPMQQEKLSKKVTTARQQRMQKTNAPSRSLTRRSLSSYLRLLFVCYHR